MEMVGGCAARNTNKNVNKEEKIKSNKNNNQKKEVKTLLR